MAAQPLPVSVAGCIPSSRRQSYTRDSAAMFQWQLMGNKQSILFVHTTQRGQSFRILANSNESSGDGTLNKEILMVDPLEAKRIAAKQKKEIEAKERLKRRRQIEAINGAWATIGLTVGLVIEGHTGKTIPEQLGGYLRAIAHFFVR